MTSSKDLLKKAKTHLDELDGIKYHDKVNDFLDSQPYLVGFLYNLADDFTEEEHEAIMRCAVLLLEAFELSNIPIGIVTQGVLNEVIEEKVEVFDKVSLMGGAQDVLLTDITASPQVFDALVGYIREDIKKGLPKDEEGLQNVFILLGILIRVFEESVIMETPKDSSPDA